MRTDTTGGICKGKLNIQKTARESRLFLFLDEFGIIGMIMSLALSSNG